MTDTITIFRERADRFSAILAGVNGRWDVASPCENWTVGEVVHHVVETERDFLVRQGLNLDDAGTTDPRQNWELHRQQVTDLLGQDGLAERHYDGYFGPTTIGETVANFYGWDLAIHGWDVAAATGQQGAITPAEAEQLLEGAEGWGEALYSEGVCRPAVQVPADADVVDRLLAKLGRDPRWTP